MDNLQDQIATLRQQNEQILSALQSLQSEFRAFRAEVLGSSDPYQFALFSPSCTPEQREQVVRILQHAVKGGSRDVCEAILVLEHDHLIQYYTLPSLYRELQQRFGYKPGLTSLKNMMPRVRKEYFESPDYYHHLVHSWAPIQTV